MADTIAALLGVRRGHFEMESGFHSDSWFELRSLFADPQTIHPFVTDLARRLAPHRPDAVCGPMTGGAKLAQRIATELGIDAVVAERFAAPGATGLFPVRYLIPDAERPRVSGRRVAIVDDAISAGSAVRGVYADLVACGALPVALGALVVLGSAAARFATDVGLPLEGIERMAFDMWPPAECPLCQAGVAVEKAAEQSG